MDLATSVLWIVLSATGTPTNLEALTQDLMRADVVFLGEEHDNDVGHAAQLEILKALHGARPDLVLSMEMFERDVQGVLDDYLKGRINEDKFLEHARPWGNYKKHYRPLVEFARQNGIDVIAANAPRPSARKMSLTGRVKSAYVARETTAPENRYFELFKEAMKDHPGEIGAAAMSKMYQAQCLKDDTMAESIAMYLAERPYRAPLVVHVNGKFHSDYGLGTAARLRQRRPLARTVVLSMTSTEKPEEFSDKEALSAGHYTLVVKAQPKKVAPKEEGDEPEEVVDTAVTTADAPATATTAEGAAPKEQPAEETPAPEEPKDERPVALGIMPDYGASEPGVMVSTAFEGRAAAKAGIKDGDLIVQIDDETIGSIEDYMDVLTEYYVGDVVKVTIKRKGKKKTLKVKLEASRR